MGEPNAELLHEANDNLPRVRQSLMVCVELLEHLARHGGPLPEWLAAEEAVTDNLTAFTLLTARSVRAAHPDEAVAKWGANRTVPDPSLAWIPEMNAAEWLMAEQLRESVSRKQPFLAAASQRTGPHGMLSAVIASLLEAASELEDTVGRGPKFEWSAEGEG